MLSYEFPLTKAKTCICTNMYRLSVAALDCLVILRQSLVLTVLDNDGKQDSEFDEACPTEAADLLGRSRLLLVLIGFVRCVCLDEGRCVDILIHDDCIHIGAFNSSRAITRCAGYTKTSVCTNSWRVERTVYLGS